IDATTTKITALTKEPYLESLALTLEALFYGELHEEQIPEVDKEIHTFMQLENRDDYSTEEMRKAIQLTVLKGMKEHTQQQQIMTTVTVSLFIGYLAEKLTNHLDKVRLFDPVSGIGNLLLIVMKHLKQTTHAYASEDDATLLKISLLNA